MVGGIKLLWGRYSFEKIGVGEFFFANSENVRTFANKLKVLIMGEKARQINEKQELIAMYAKALASPIRVQILHFLAMQDTCFFGDINEILPIAKSTASKHLSDLKKAGLIQGEVNPPRVKYCINREKWHEAQQLMNEFFGLADVKKCCCSK